MRQTFQRHILIIVKKNKSEALLKYLFITFSQKLIKKQVNENLSIIKLTS